MCCLVCCFFVWCWVLIVLRCLFVLSCLLCYVFSLFCCVFVVMGYMRGCVVCCLFWSSVFGVWFVVLFVGVFCICEVVLLGFVVGLSGGFVG